MLVANVKCLYSTLALYSIQFLFVAKPIPLGFSWPTRWANLAAILNHSGFGVCSRTPLSLPRPSPRFVLGHGRDANSDGFVQLPRRGPCHVEDPCLRDR